MMYEGNAIRCERHDGDIAVMTFNAKDASANVFNANAIKDLDACLKKLKAADLKGLILRSDKRDFILGADITEFLTHFTKADEELSYWLDKINTIFTGYENLPFPTVAAINGMALGGGFEICLTMDYRLADATAKIGLPETKLGIIPGWGGTARFPRITGANHAIEWITSGKPYKADAGLKIGIIDGVVTNDLLEAAMTTLDRANSGDLDWKAKRAEKQAPLYLNQVEAGMVFETAKGFVSGVAGPNYPAPVASIKVMQKSATLTSDEAIKVETKAFVKMAKTKTAESLVYVFLGNQFLKKQGKTMTKSSPAISKAAVLGAGIMGGGIAYQSSSKGTPIVMKDIAEAALDLGMGEATNLLNKQLKRKKIDAAKMAKTISNIAPTLNYGAFDTVDIVVEAVVENPKIKASVLKEVESKIGKDKILASNTSTISITSLAKDLARPENFCGMHFFNPVHLMPLVEVIRGEKTSDATIASVVKYAMQMGKTPIIVNDCPGFLVNRILFPYFNGFIKLVEDGVDFKRIDKVMEKFGWPMGPAYLLDVVGIDTALHASDIMGEGFPDRMKHDGKTVLNGMFEAGRYGQKTNLGFYEYKKDRKGKLRKHLNEESDAVIKPFIKNSIDISDEDIIGRMMFPMIIESARCFEEKIVSTPTEVDMGLILGIGFPPFRAGALKYADDLGGDTLLAMQEKYASMGNAYKLTETMTKMAKENQKYYKKG